MLVREAAREDGPELARLRWEFRAEDQPGRSLPEFILQFETWFQEALASRSWTVAVADSGSGLLQGCMYLHSIHKVPVPGGVHRFWGYVTNAYVAPEHRGKGIGRKLLDHLVDAARARGFEFLIVWPSRQSVEFYQRAGFRSAANAHPQADDVPPFEMVL